MKGNSEGNPGDRVRLVLEPCYTFRSADNVRRYHTEVDLTGGTVPLFTFGVVVDDTPAMVIGARAGAGRGIHAHSSFRLESSVYIAAGAHVVRFTPGERHPDWILALEGGTCLGVRYDAPHDALISHGDLCIRRFSREG